MKILMLNYEFPPIGGGGGQAHLALLRQYAGRGDLQVDVLTSAPRPGLVIERFTGNIAIRRVGIDKKDLHLWRRSEVIRWLVKAGPQYRRMIAENQYDLIHVFFGFPTGWLCYRDARRPPYIVSLRGSDVPGANARLKLEYMILGPLVFKPIWRRAAALVACSEGLKRRALKFLPSAKIDVIANGVDLERFSPAEPGSGNAGPGPLRLLTVGRLSATKRVPLLIEAVEALNKQGCNVELTIVGGGALKDELERLVAQRNLSNAVHLCGRVESEEMPVLYRRHDVFVGASMQEGMSNAMLEAMASGLPIVTTRCEGVDELVADNGVIVDGAEPAALARVIGTLAADCEARRAMSVAAGRRAKKFTWTSAAERYIELYKQVTG